MHLTQRSHGKVTSLGATVETLCKALAWPSRQWTSSEALARPSPVPRSRGMYAWYFRQIPGRVPVEGCHIIDGSMLLYVGIAPASETSMATLRTRICTHFRGNAAGSTLRLTLGCLLSARLGLRLQRTGRTGRLTFGEDEKVLSSWLDENALVVWAECDHPWTHEAQIIRHLSPPLNLDHNQDHPFHKALAELRSRCRREARAA